MIVFEWVLGILLVSVLLSALARQLQIPYPTLLALGGAVLAFIPGAPRIELDPELALALFVAPVLLDAAYDTSPRDLRDNWVPVTCLVAPTVKGGLIISWCGMRGIVTLVAALALPNGDGGPSFPYRDLIVLVAFCVVLGTLLIQGLTLRPLLEWLDLRDDDPVGREVAHARVAAYGAALASLDGAVSPLAEALRVELKEALAQMNGDSAGQGESSPGDGLRLQAVAAARAAILGLRRDGEIGDDAFHRVEEEIDRIELSAMG
jgi:monovalent cation/hydrogen antiporter